MKHFFVMNSEAGIKTRGVEVVVPGFPFLGRQAGCVGRGMRRRGGSPGWWCSVARRARRQGRGRATGRPRSEGGAHKIRKKKAIVLRYARVRLLLACPYSTPLGLRLGLFPCPYPWGLVGGAMGAAATPWGRTAGAGQAGRGSGRLSNPPPPTLPPGHEVTCPPKNTCPRYLLENTANIAGGHEGHENQGGISKVKSLYRLTI